jgi:hypothetical protein
MDFLRSQRTVIVVSQVRTGVAHRGRVTLEARDVKEM